MSSSRFSFSFLLFIVLFSCHPAKHRDPVLGQAFIGPASVNLRQEITPKSSTVATAHFGDKVEIVAIRRRFAKVRNAKGAEGWLEDFKLLSQSDIDQIKAQSAAARDYPSQGIATTYEAMSVRAQPNRYSPSYIQIKEGEKFDVLEHRVVQVPPSAIHKALISTNKPAKSPKRENKSKVPPPPSPKPPTLPLDWRELSKAGEDAVLPKPDEPPPTTPEEDWSLVRTSSGQSGWVLTRRLYMAIPDEVAQYAEGKRITSYFKLGKVQDGERVKDIWLWTTIGSANQRYDFDGVRVFIWSLRHHRYESALILRRLQGFFPTIADSSAGTFGVCLAKDDGQHYRREYRLVEKQVKLVGEKPCDLERAGKNGPSNAPAKAQNPPEGTLDKLKSKFKSIVK